MSSVPIKRVSHTTDETAPWEGVVFTYDVGSDELDEALRACFPTHGTLRRRKHAAIIQFLTDELSEMPLSKSSVRTPSAYGDQDVLVTAQCPMRPRNTQAAAQSPATSNGSLAVQEKSEHGTTPSTPAAQPSYIDPMAATHSSQFVFNAFDGRAMQQKTKRRMTAEERVEYKETRRRGACSKCKRQKGKVSVEVQQ